MFFIAYAFKGQVHVFAGRVKIVSHSCCRTSTILIFLFPGQAYVFIPIYQYMRNSDAPTFHIQQEMSCNNGRYEAAYLSINLIKHGKACFLGMICLNNSQIWFEH